MFPAETRREPPALPSGVALASVGRRVLGYLLDSVLCALPSGFYLVRPMLAKGTITDLVNGKLKIDEGQLFIATLITAVIWVVYQTVMLAIWGRTVGKFATGTRLVRADSGGRPGWDAVLIRSLCTAIASVIPVVSMMVQSVVLMWATFDPRRQGLHDKAAGTLVALNAPAAP